MGKVVGDVVLDAALAKIATATSQIACSAQPANYAGIAAVTLATATMTAGDGNDYAIADGDGGGRKVTMAQKTGVTITGAGTQQANHVSLDDGVALLYVTTCTAQDLVNGNTMTFNTWKVEIADPA